MQLMKTAHANEVQHEYSTMPTLENIKTNKNCHDMLTGDLWGDIPRATAKLPTSFSSVIAGAFGRPKSADRADRAFWLIVSE